MFALEIMEAAAGWGDGVGVYSCVCVRETLKPPGVWDFVPESPYAQPPHVTPSRTGSDAFSSVRSIIS